MKIFWWAMTLLWVFFAGADSMRSDWTGMLIDIVFAASALFFATTYESETGR